MNAEEKKEYNRKRQIAIGDKTWTTTRPKGSNEKECRAQRRLELVEEGAARQKRKETDKAWKALQPPKRKGRPVGSRMTPERAAFRERRNDAFKR